MKFSAVLISLVAAAGFVAAQSNTNSAPVPTNTSSYDPVTVACLGKCDESDVNCRAACFGNPHPNENDVNATTQCAMKCVQGDGTEEQTAKYAACQQKCITDLFLTTSGVIGKPTGSAGSPTQSGSDSKTSDDADSEDADSDASKDGESADKKDDESSAGKLAVSAGGAIALALVALAL